MSTCTLAVDATNYAFQGYGTHTPLYEKGYPLANSALDLVNAGDYTAFDALINELKIFSWMRMLVGGGELFRPCPDGARSSPAKKQAELMARMNAAQSWRYVLSPYAPPDAMTVGGSSRTFLNTNSAGDLAFAMNFTGNWQGWLDNIDRDIQTAMGLGCHIEYVGTPSECGVNTGGGTNWWMTCLTSADYDNWVSKVWLGTGLSGGGLSARYPGLLLVADDPAANYTAPTALTGDAPALAAVSTYGHHDYIDNVSGGGSVVEMGLFTATADASLTVALMKPFVHNNHDCIYARFAKFACMWTSLRDETAKAPAYTAKPIANLTTASHTYALTPWWWALKPYVLAAGRSPSLAVFGGSAANYDPATGVYVNVFIRGDDGKVCVVYANFSAGSTTDTLAFTLGGSAHNYSGTSKTYTPLTTTTEPTPAAASTTAGSIVLGTVTAGTIILFELS